MQADVCVSSKNVLAYKFFFSFLRPPPPTTVDEVKESYIEKLKLLRQEVKDKLGAKKHKKPKKVLHQVTGNAKKNMI